jgi:uncharacterized protein (TIGR03083 family)
MTLPPPPQVPTTREGLVAAVESTLSATANLAASVTEEQAMLPTPCTGWTVRDQVAHVVGLESRLLGRPAPDSHQLPVGLAHVTTDTKRFMELDVDARRARPWAEVQAEAADVLLTRIESLRTLDFDADTLVDTPFGPRPARAALGLRTFDAWAHEQDIRDALGVPGGMDSPAAAVAIARSASSLGHIATEAGLSDDQAVTVVVTDGPFAFEASSNPAAASVATLSMDAATFTRLCCGRSSADKTRVSIDGDAGVARKFLDSMAVTP